MYDVSSSSTETALLKVVSDVVTSACDRRRLFCCHWTFLPHSTPLTTTSSSNVSVPISESAAVHLAGSVQTAAEPIKD